MRAHTVDRGWTLLLSALLAAACMLVVGGCSDRPSDSSELTPSDGAWLQLEVSGDTPSDGWPFEMVYAADSDMLIACGSSSRITDAGTWVIDTATGVWEERNGSLNSPSVRASHCLVYVSLLKKAILFGGEDRLTGDELNDIWEYDQVADVWTERHPSGDLPDPRSSASMVYVGDSGLLILFGGWLSTKEGDGSLASSLAGDTWAYDPTADSWTPMTTRGNGPAPRSEQAMAYDEKTGKVIMYGGVTGKGDVNDTWAYDPATNVWTELHPMGDLPQPRRGHSMVFDRTSGKIVMFGGTVGYRGVNDTWTYDSAANQWTEALPEGQLPPPRSNQAMASDSASGSVIMFGGWGEGVRVLSDMWVYSSE